MEKKYRVHHEIVALNLDKTNTKIAELLNKELKLKGEEKYTAAKVASIKGSLTKQYTGENPQFKNKNALIKFFQKEKEERLRVSENETLRTKRVEFLNKYFSDGKFVGDSVKSVFEKISREFSKEKILQNLTIEEFRNLLVDIWKFHYQDNFSKSGKFVVKELAESMLLTRFPADFVANGLKKLYGNEPKFDPRVPDLIQKIAVGGFSDKLVSESQIFSSKEKPITIPSEEKGGLYVVNGLHIGIADSDLLEHKSPVLVSRLAREANAAAMIIQNPFELAYISRKSSGSASHIQRGVLSNLDVSYLKKHNLLSKSLSKDLESDIDFVTPLEKFLSFLFYSIGLFNKPAQNKEGWEPIYPGPIYFVLGTKEDQLIKQIADDEMSLRTKQLQAELEMKKKFKKIDAQEAANLSKRIIRSNESEEYRQKIESRVRNIFVQLLQLISPNVRVAGFSEAYFIFKDKKVKSVTDSRETPQDNSLAKYTQYLRSQALHGSYIPDALLIGAPASIRCSTSVVELEMLKDQPNVYAFQLPTCVNKKFLKSYLKPHPSIKYTIKKLVDDDCFEPGIMILDVVGDGFTHGVISFEHLIQIASKKNIRKWKPGTEQSYGGVKYINMLIDTDQHYGSPDQAWINCPWLDKSVPIGEAFKALYMRDGVSGIHLISHNDDPTQGEMPFLRPGEKRSHRATDPLEFQKMLQKFLKGIKDGNLTPMKLKEYHKYFNDHYQNSGIHDAHYQLNTAVESMVGEWIDFYHKVYLDGEKAGVKVVGPGVIEKVFDPRDLGRINFGSGNHWFMNQATLEGNSFLQRLVRGLIQKGLPQEEILKVVKSPALAMDPSVGYGRIGVGDNFSKYHYLWYFRNRPANKGVDFLNATKNEMKNLMLVGERSLIPGFAAGLHLIQTLGDKHMHSVSYGENVTCAMSGPGTKSNNYMEKGGFVPHNTGVVILSLPADGPQAGPIFVTFYTYSMIDKAASGEGSMDWYQNHGLSNAL